MTDSDWPRLRLTRRTADGRADPAGGTGRFGWPAAKDVSCRCYRALAMLVHNMGDGKATQRAVQREERT